VNWDRSCPKWLNVSPQAKATIQSSTASIQEFITPPKDFDWNLKTILFGTEKTNRNLLGPLQMPTSERRNSCCSGRTTTTSTSSNWKMVGTWTDRVMEQQTRPYGCVGNSGTIGYLGSPWEISYFSREIVVNIDEPVDLGAGCRLAYWQIHHDTRQHRVWEEAKRGGIHPGPFFQDQVSLELVSKPFTALPKNSKWASAPKVPETASLNRLLKAMWRLGQELAPSFCLLIRKSLKNAQTMIFKFGIQELWLRTCSNFKPPTVL